MFRLNDQFEHSLLTEWLNSSDVGLCVVDDNNLVVMLNVAGCRLLGIKHAESINHTLQYVLRNIGEALALGTWLVSPESDAGHCVSREDSGGKIHLLLKSRVIEHASGRRFRAISVTDVTALLESQEQLVAQRRIEIEQRQWQALNAGVVICDALEPDMPIIYVNPMFETMSGYSSSDILGKNCRFMQGLELHQAGVSDIREAIKNKVNGYAVLRNYRKDGTLFINELFISPVRNARGDVIQFVGIQHLRPDGYTKKQFII